MFFLEILTAYIVPMIYSSFFCLVLALFFLFIFRIKDSNIRILFFFLPLVKPFIIIAEKIDESYFQSALTAPVITLLRFPDPNNILKIFKEIERGPAVLSSINYLVLFLISIGIIRMLKVIKKRRENLYFKKSIIKLRGIKKRVVNFVNRAKLTNIPIAKILIGYIESPFTNFNSPKITIDENNAAMISLLIAAEMKIN